MAKRYGVILSFAIGLVLLAIVSAWGQNTVLWPAWAVRFDATNQNDEAKALTVDNAGNVYVTGQCYVNPLNGYDIFTIKYDPNGNILWIRIFNGAGSGADCGVAITLDMAGNVFVTGYSWWGAGQDYNYITIMYNPGGGMVWSMFYNGPGSVADYAKDIVFNPVTGNVYVTGYSWGGGLTNYDYATICYNLLGVQLWVDRYNFANLADYGYAIDVHQGSGFIFVTGASNGGGTNFDYATVVYNPGGPPPVWTGRFNGAMNNIDRAYDIAVHQPTGNFIVTGESYQTSAASPDYTTIQYAWGGGLMWMMPYNGPGNSTDIARAVAVDMPGNVFVTGQSFGGGTRDDYATIMYNPGGGVISVSRYNYAPANWDDLAFSIAVDPASMYYVTGWSSQVPGANADYATIWYAPGGPQICAKRFDGIGSANDIANDIALDNSSNVYVTGGSFSGAATGNDYLTIKYIKCLCGDVNLDAVVDIGDIVLLINYVFYSGAGPLCDGDVNIDGVVDIGDIVFLINYVFYSGVAPVCAC
jgi:hypothetical protein